MRQATEQDIIREIEERFEKLKGMIAGRVQPSANRIEAAAQIRRHVAEYFGLTDEDLLGNDRSNRVAWPRMIAACILRDLLNPSIQDTAELLRYDDANSVRYAVKTVRARSEAYPLMAAAYEALKDEIRLKWPAELFAPVAKGDFEPGK